MKTNHAFILSTLCFILFVAVIVATPVGGWNRLQNLFWD
jgi:hypothetical protein